MRLETLHVAALPYPTSQGTQAAIGLMVGALAQTGRRTELLTYAAGDGVETRFAHRTTAGRVRPRSLRSGPSLEKIAADVELASTLRTLAREADVVVAHHVEAAALAALLGLPRWIFFAHTTLGPELPTYLPRALAPAATRAGEALDRWLVRRAPAVMAISTLVARQLEALGAREVTVAPVPLAPIAASISRDEARRALGLVATDEVVLYAGNLDAYQGLSALVHAMTELRALRPAARLLVATESSSDELARALGRRGHTATFARLRGEPERALASAAADVAVVTRGAPGGYPIKLLDAIARGVPVVAMRRALSGHEVPGVFVTDDDPVALGRGLRSVLARSDTERAELRARALAHLTHAHTAERFAAVLDEVIAGLPPTLRGTR
ncbi:MAG: glycosyltransferase [Sandaracinus sp.]